MTAMPLAAYLYYPSPHSPPVLVERLGQWVCECGECGWRPLAHYPGRFVRLVPVAQTHDSTAADSGDAPHCHQ